MALYRTVSMSFWTDNKVIDDFTPEDRYFYLYLFTNPHTNLCGCYEVSIKQMSNETGYSKDSIENLIRRFEKEHDVLRFSKETKEILLINWSKYNWTSSDKFRKPLEKEINGIKNPEFREFLLDVFHNGCGINTCCLGASVGTISNNLSEEKSSPISTVHSCSLDRDAERRSKKPTMISFIKERNFDKRLEPVLVEWCRYKTEKRQSYKPTGFSKFLSEVQHNVDKYGVDEVISVFNIAMANNWQGVAFWKLKESKDESATEKVKDMKEW